MQLRSDKRSRKRNPTAMSRRSFLPAREWPAGAIVLRSAIPGAFASDDAAAETAAMGPGSVPFTLEINGASRTRSVEPHMTLAKPIFETLVRRPILSAAGHA
jgi:hypothetical protein